MARLVGYMANRTDRLQQVLECERSVVAPLPPTRPTGWGLGFYQGGDPLYKKRPNLEGTTLDWSQVTHGVVSDCVVLHVRQPTIGDFRVENTHPFRFQQWLFAHSGDIDAFESMRPRFQASLPDFLRRSIRGNTDSEHLFGMILHHLSQCGALEGYEVRSDIVVTAIRQCLEEIDAWSHALGEKVAPVNAILTNGRQMFVVARGTPMVWTARSTPSDRGEPGMDRYILAVSGTDELPPGYNAMEQGSVLVVERNLTTRVHNVSAKAS